MLEDGTDVAASGNSTDRYRIRVDFDLFCIILCLLQESEPVSRLSNDFIELTQFNAAQESSKHLSKVASVDPVSTISLNVKSTLYLDNVDN